MYTLFSITVGGEVATTGRPILEKQPLILFFHLGFTVLMSIGIMNVIVGVIVESTLDSARVIDQQVEREETTQQIQRMDNIQTPWLLLIRILME